MGNILVDHPKVAEAVVIGKQHEIKGQAICAFVVFPSLALGREVGRSQSKQNQPHPLFYLATARRQGRGWRHH